MYKCDDHPIPIIYLGSCYKTYQTNIRHYRHILTSKLASFDKTVYPLAMAIKTKHVLVKEVSEPKYNFSGHRKSRDVAFSGSNMQNIFDQNVQTALHRPL